jgi:hypothetical protein
VNIANDKQPDKTFAVPAFQILKIHRFQGIRCSHYPSGTEESCQMAQALLCDKLKEFATRCIKRQLPMELGFITRIQIREQRASLIVDILQDQISGR